MSGLTEEQRYLFDTFGYIVLRDVLTTEQVEEMRSTLQRPTEQFGPVPQKEGPLHWSKVWRDLIDLPHLSPVLEEIIGNHGTRVAREKAGREPMPTFRLDHINVHTHIKKGFKGATLHGGWKGTGGSQFSSYHDGFFYNGLISVSYELYDTHPNNGGFGCIPGSHKSNIRLPEKWRIMNEEIPDCVTRIPAVPGRCNHLHGSTDARHVTLDFRVHEKHCFLQVFATWIDVVVRLLRSERVSRISRYGCSETRDSGSSQRQVPWKTDRSFWKRIGLNQ